MTSRLQENIISCKIIIENVKILKYNNTYFILCNVIIYNGTLSTSRQKKMLFF